MSAATQQLLFISLPPAAFHWLALSHYRCSVFGVVAVINSYEMSGWYGLIISLLAVIWGIGAWTVFKSLRRTAGGPRGVARPEDGIC